MEHLLLILLGGPVAIGGPALVARRLVEGHANRTAAAIRTQHAEPAPAPVQRPAATRTKVVAR
ncbi:hypothetical protein [Micromonospora sp. HUAS LYJ1]|uniref:hypothetical protein n=1 Tax=Micromonospora sp. HUAS LYJ1 TaxID=3061626 RepID=UPI002673D616|nr:hypothetical protein [Micromonospora sp. HUAS LYJ1]WKU08026.1 hypothetical protein Q2K16_13840 [Micromonospora sp. HUAS LYJ1]